jgi:hypothetical protein
MLSIHDWYRQDVFSHDENFQDRKDRETQGENSVAEIVNAARVVVPRVFLIVRSFQQAREASRSPFRR